MQHTKPDPGLPWPLSTRRLLARVLLATSVLLVFSWNASYAQDSAYKSTLFCETTEITIATTCLTDSRPRFPNCQNQRIAFKDIRTGRIKIVNGSGELVVDKFRTGGMTLDGLAGGWACVKGTTKSYLVLEYFNGGNCDECEWYEIFAADGRKMTKNERQDSGVVDVVAKRLGFSKGWPKQLKPIAIEPTARN